MNRMREKIIVSYSYCWGPFRKLKKRLVRQANKNNRHKKKIDLKQGKLIDRIYHQEGGIWD